MSDVIIVLGMHRSGTSAVAGVLTKLGGAAPTSLMPANSGNERGYFESVAFMQFHDELLASAGSSWQDWRVFNPGFYKSPVGLDYRRRAKELFAAEFGDSALPILKDPRICRFVPFWFEVLKEMRSTPRVVIPVRSPLDVAHSLKTRDGFSLAKGLLLWLRHSLDAEVQTRAEARSVFTWNSFHSDWHRVCDKIASDIGLSWPRMSDRTSHEIDRFLTKELIHHDTDHVELLAHSDVHEWTLRAYEAMLELARNPFSNSAMDTLDQIRGQLEQASHLFGRILVDYEIDIETLHAQTFALTHERDLLQIREAEIQSEKDAAAAEWLARAQQAESAHQETLRDKEALSRSLATTAAELGTMREALQRSVAELIAQQQEAAVSAAATAAELGTMREALQRSVTELEARQQEAVANSMALTDLTARVTQTEGALSKALSERDAFSQSLATQAVELADARASAEALAYKHSEALAALDSSRAERAAIETAHADLAAKLSRALDENNALATRLDHTTAEARRLEQAANTRAATQEAVYQQTLTTTKKAHESEIEALRKQLVDSEAGLSNLRSKNARIGLWAKWLQAPIRRRLLARRLLRSGLFDAAWYRAEYPEARTEGLSPAEHYIETGFCRGYRPNPFFDTRWYLDRYEDVRRSGVNPLLHYALHGFKEGRDPGPAFQTDFYLAANPDVRAKGVNPLAHYLRHGRHEGRMPERPI